MEAPVVLYARRGLASPELLVVLLIVIGVLAAIGLQRYGALKEGAAVTVMVDNLRSLAVSEEAYFADHATYYGGEVPSPALTFFPTDGVRATIESAGKMGWSATATVAGIQRRCRVVFGDGGTGVPAIVQNSADCGTVYRQPTAPDAAQDQDTARR